MNLFIANPNIGQLSSMYMYAWKRGLKTTYYLRSRPATSIAKTTVRANPAATTPDTRRGHRLLARKSGDLRGLPMSRACSIPASI